MVGVSHRCSVVWYQCFVVWCQTANHMFVCWKEGGSTCWHLALLQAAAQHLQHFQAWSTIGQRWLLQLQSSRSSKRMAPEWGAQNAHDSRWKWVALPSSQSQRAPGCWCLSVWTIHMMEKVQRTEIKQTNIGVKKMTFHVSFFTMIGRLLKHVSRTAYS